MNLQGKKYSNIQRLFQVFGLAKLPERKGQKLVCKMEKFDYYETMVRYTVLGSGSCGNSYYFESGEGSLLIDAGYSCRELLRRIELCGFDPGRLRGIAITHCHSDHIRGAEVTARKLDIPLFLHKKNNPELIFKNPPSKIVGFDEKSLLIIAGFQLSPMPTMHDDAHSLTYTISIDGWRASIITDTGKTDDLMLERAVSSDVLFLEANYDRQMLAEGPYPYHLKKRISSARGHLSNEDAAEFLNKISMKKNSKLKKVYLCHLSESNNCPEILGEELKTRLQWQGSWHICRRGEIVGDGNIGPAGE